MLDQFLTVAYEQTERAKEKRAYIDNLKKLPREELFRLATGEKLAWAEPVKAAHDSDSVACWIDQFKGTPLFDQAVMLEQADLQLEAQDIQRRMQQPPPDDLWVQRDQLRLQKRLLELQLAQASGGGAHLAAAPQQATPPAPELTGSQGAGAVGSEELDNTEAVHNRPVGSPGLKMGSAELARAAERMKAAAAMHKAAAALPRALARADGEKLALSIPPGAGGMLKNIAAKLGPHGTKALLGAGIGAAGGAFAGGHDREGWHPLGAITGALGGAALGGMAGHIGGNVAELHARGMPIGKALGAGAQMSGRQLLRAGKGALEKGRGLVGEVGSPKAPAA